jgi:hydroxymethylpyrimidine/phosphomethylpyrimidine kinase
VERVTPVVAAIGTTHPYASTGLLLELTALRALDVRPVAVVAGISAQDAAHVTARQPVDAVTIERQFSALAGAGVAACSIGALLDPASVEAVARGVAALGVPAVCDPVIAASAGDRLADDATIAALRDALFARCALIVPNLDEAGLLIGSPLRTLADVHAALARLLTFGPRAVLVTGGHLAGDPCDVFSDGARVVEFRAPRLAGELRGTGTLLCAAIAAHLARGHALEDAIRAARTFVRARIAGGVPFAGMRVAY